MSKYYQNLLSTYRSDVAVNDIFGVKVFQAFSLFRIFMDGKFLASTHPRQFQSKASTDLNQVDF